MKKLCFLLLPFFLFFTAQAQDTYSYYYASYMVEGGKREMMVCSAEPFEWVNDKVSGYSGINYIPEAKFRSWLDTRFGSRASGRDFYPCTSKEQAIEYYKDFANTYQGHTPFQNSSYCSSLYSIAYVAPERKSTTPTNNSGNTFSGNGSESSSGNSSSYSTSSSTNTSSTETDAQREYREQRERIAASQKRSEDLDNQIIQGTTELAGMIGNIAAQNRADREKKEARKEAERVAKANAATERWVSLKEDLKSYLPRAENGELTYIILVYDLYYKLGDVKNGEYWVRKATDNYVAKFADGDKTVLRDLAYTHYHYRENNYDLAVRWMEEYVNYDPNAQEQMYQLARLYQYGSKKANGNNITSLSQVNLKNQKQEKAIYWYEKAAMKGHVEALDALWKIYTNGTYIFNYGFEKYRDRKKEREWYRRYKAAIK